MADDEQYDTPSVEEVHQGDTPGDIPPVRTEVVNPVRVDHLPTRIGDFESRNIILNAAAVRILGYDELRCGVQLWCFAEDVVLGRTQAECEQGTGPIISGGLAIPYRFGFCDELWAKVATGGTANATLNIVSERWAR